jgi:hypothetical protein
MRAYRLKYGEKGPWTHVFVLTTSDFSVGFSNKQIALASIAAGDVIYPAVLVEVKTAVTGPTGTPTGSVGITGTVTRFTAATSVVATGRVVPDEAVAPFVAGSATSLLYDLQAGGGDAAAATAGEIWIWAQLLPAADRTLQA